MVKEKKRGGKKKDIVKIINERVKNKEKKPKDKPLKIVLPSPAKPKPLTDEENKFYYDRLWNNPKRNEVIWNTLNQLIVGEDNNKKVIFYNFLSSKLDTPNHTIIVGDASGGKTHMVREVLKLFPKEMKMIAGSLSRKTLQHLHGELKYEGKVPIKYIDMHGKILVILEAKGVEDSFDTLRQILSRDQEEIPFYTVSKKKAKGGSEFQSADKTVISGSPAFATTTTSIDILPEMGTRVFTLTPDETKDHSKEIIEWKKLKYKLMKKKPSYAAFHKFIRELKSYEVWVPFVDIIDLPIKTLNIRRDFDKIVSLIMCNALLNQFERKKINLDGREVLVASMQDYIDVMPIILPILTPTLLNLPGKLYNFFQLLRQKKLEIMTHKSVAEALKMNQDTVKNYCYNLYKGGRLLMVKEGVQNRYFINTGSEDHDSGDTLRNFYTVPLNTLARSLESTKSFLLSNRNLYNKENSNINPLKIDIHNTLFYVYFPVPLVTALNYDATELEDLKNEVTHQIVTGGYHSVVKGEADYTCISCGIASPPAKLDDQNLCEICRSNPEVKEEKEEVKKEEELKVTKETVKDE
jgi:hypothetical protein